MHKLTVCAIAIILLTGCADLRPKIPQVITGPMVAVDCRDLLDYYENYSRMNSERRKQELISTAETCSLAPGDCNQLRLALILSQSDNPEEERKKALKLLTDLLDGENDLPMQARQLARLLKEQLKQQQSLQLRIHKLRNDLKQERMASQLQLKQLSDLQSQLQQLKNIEESINEKEQAIIIPATTPPHEPAQNSTGR